jgi:hypothetical protein
VLHACSIILRYREAADQAGHAADQADDVRMQHCPLPMELPASNCFKQVVAACIVCIQQPTWLHTTGYALECAPATYDAHARKRHGAHARQCGADSYLNMHAQRIADVMPHKWKKCALLRAL